MGDLKHFHAMPTKEAKPFASVLVFAPSSERVSSYTAAPQLLLMCCWHELKACQV